MTLRDDYLLQIQANFGGMKSPEFAAWLEDYLAHREVHPQLPKTRDDRIIDLVNLYNALPVASTGEFRAALDHLLDNVVVPRDQSQHDVIEAFFYLIQLANLAKPERGKRVLRRLISVDYLYEIFCEGQRLHSAILNAACRYDVDAEMITQILRLATIPRGLGYSVMCMRLLSYSMNSDVTYGLLERILPLLETQQDAAYFGRELLLIVKRLGVSGLLNSYQLLKSEMSGKYPRQFDFFESILTATLLPRLVTDANHLKASEPAAALLQIHLSTDDRGLGMAEILQIARMATVTVPRQAIVRLLADLRARQYSEDRSLSLWYLESLDDHQGYAEKPGAICIFAGGTHEYLSIATDAFLIEIFRDAESLNIADGYTSEQLDRLYLMGEDGKFAEMIGSEAGGEFDDYS